MREQLVALAASVVRGHGALGTEYGLPAGSIAAAVNGGVGDVSDAGDGSTPDPLVADAPNAADAGAASTDAHGTRPPSMPTVAEASLDDLMDAAAASELRADENGASPPRDDLPAGEGSERPTNGGASFGTPVGDRDASDSAADDVSGQAPVAANDAAAPDDMVTPPAREGRSPSQP